MPGPPASSFSKPQRKQPRHGSSLPLLAFAGAKKTTYDPRVAKKQASNLAAKRVNEFRKLKARMEAEGKLAVPSSIARATMSAAEGEGGDEKVTRRGERAREKKERRREAAATALKKETQPALPFPFHEHRPPDENASRRPRARSTRNTIKAQPRSLSTLYNG